jgi:diaminopimelate epimerase
MRFAKYHGTGNDFVMIEDLEDRVTLTPALVAGLCDRHMGVGADGVIRVAPSDRADFFMDYWNADGNVAEMCGNGIRCLGKLAFDRGLTTRTDLRVDTRDGVKHLTLTVSDGAVDAVRVDMGPPRFARADLPMAGEGELRDEPWVVDGMEVRAHGVSMGNPHLVLIGDVDSAKIDVIRLGPPLEHDERFPQRTNVEFVKVEDGVVNVRVWERGSGETMACGTGACASLVASARAGLVPRGAPVRFPGGLLRVEWAEDTVYLEGPAAFVFEGEMSRPWVEARLAEAGR